MTRQQWRRVFDILRSDEDAGITTTPDERRNLVGMVRSGLVFWRCTFSPPQPAIG